MEMDESFHAEIDIVVKVYTCEHRTCPFFPGVCETIHTGFPDHSDGEEMSCVRIARFREIRDQIIALIDQSFVPGYRQIRIRP